MAWKDGVLEECKCYEGKADCKFFFGIVKHVSSSFPVVFGNSGGNKPHSQAYRDFQAKWGFLGTLYQMAGEKIEKVAEIYQEYLVDALQLISYMTERSNVDKEEDKFQEMIRPRRR